MLTKCSYGPYARAMVRICKEERFHERQGYEIMRALAQGTAEQRAMAQSALDRWWWPTLMMFGPPDAASEHNDVLMGWRVKQKSNDELRQWFVDLAVPQAQALPLEIPDPELALGRRGQALADRADRLGRVLAGRARRRHLQPRAAARRAPKAHDEGRWVREAAEAWAGKQRA